LVPEKNKSLFLSLCLYQTYGKFFYVDCDLLQMLVIMNDCMIYSID